MKTVTELAQQIADQELNACCEWLSNEVLCESNVHRFLLAARRPKPQSLKEKLLQAIVAGDQKQAIELLENLDDSL